jgi:hypothetical protein
MGQSTFLERLPDKEWYRNMDITCPASKRHERQQAKHVWPTCFFHQNIASLPTPVTPCMISFWGFISSFEYRHERSRALTCYILFRSGLLLHEQQPWYNLSQKSTNITDLKIFTMYALWNAWLQKTKKPNDSQPRLSWSILCIPLKLHTERRPHLTHYHQFHLEMASYKQLEAWRTLTVPLAIHLCLCITTACIFTYNPHYVNYL